MTEQVAHSPFAALRYREFVVFISANCIATIALLITEVVLGYSIYQMTHDPLALGLIGLAEALPFISLTLFGGHFADRMNKKVMLLGSLATLILGSMILIWATSIATGLAQRNMLIVIYGVIVLMGFSRGFYSPASNAWSAFLIPRAVFTNATTWQSSFWQVGAIMGPGVAGFLYAYLGLTATLWCVTGLLAVVMVLISTLTSPPIPVASTEELSIFKSLREGISYVFSTKIILYSISLDLFSVLFGGVTALLPVFSVDVLHVGAEGLGILRAAPSLGAFLTMVGLVYFPPMKHAWRNLLMAVAGFGLATLVFAVSRNMWLSCAALFLAGGFDSVSMIVRQTVIYFSTPDNMRGRVSSVNGIFISSSNELGAFESGVAAKLMGTVPSVVFGGMMTMFIVTVTWFRSKEFFSLEIK
jgi:MFS family permease